MALVVDEICLYPATMTIDKGLPGMRWSHLWSTLDGVEGEQELVAFARRIGCRERWIQHKGTPRVHFDLTPSMRARALKMGALPVNAQEYAHAKLDGPEAVARLLAAGSAIRHTLFDSSSVEGVPLC